MLRGQRERKEDWGQRTRQLEREKGRGGKATVSRAPWFPHSRIDHLMVYALYSNLCVYSICMHIACWEAVKCCLNHFFYAIISLMYLWYLSETRNLNYFSIFYTFYELCFSLRCFPFCFPIKLSTVSFDDQLKCVWFGSVYWDREQVSWVVLEICTYFQLIFLFSSLFFHQALNSLI